MLNTSKPGSDEESRGVKRDWAVSNSEVLFTESDHSSLNKRVKSNTQQDHAKITPNGDSEIDVLLETNHSQTHLPTSEITESTSDASRATVSHTSAAKKLNQPRAEQLGCRLFTLLENPVEQCLLATACARLLGMHDSHVLFTKFRNIHRHELGREDKFRLIADGVLLAKHARRKIFYVTLQSVLSQFECENLEELAALAQKLIVPVLAKPNAETQAFVSSTSDTLRNGPSSENGPAYDAELKAFQDRFANASQNINKPASTLSRPEVLAVPRPRIEMAGIPFVDKSQPTPLAELQSQATQIAEYSKLVNLQRGMRATLQKQEYAADRQVPKLTEIIPGIPCINFIPEDAQSMKPTLHPGTMSNLQKMQSGNPGGSIAPGLMPGRSQSALNQMMPNGVGHNVGQRTANIAPSITNPSNTSVAPNGWGSGPAPSPGGPVFQHRQSLTAVSPSHAQSSPPHVPMPGHFPPNQSAAGLPNHASHVVPNLGNFQGNLGPARAMLGHPQMNMSQMPASMAQRVQNHPGAAGVGHGPALSQSNWDTAQF